MDKAVNPCAMASAQTFQKVFSEMFPGESLGDYLSKLESYNKPAPVPAPVPVLAPTFAPVPASDKDKDWSKRREIVKWLKCSGAQEYISCSELSKFLHISKRVIKDAENSGELPSVNCSLYDLEKVADWLLRFPLYASLNRSIHYLVEDSPEVRKNLLSIHEAAKVLNYSESSIRSFIRQGRLSRVWISVDGKPGRESFITIDSVNHFLSERSKS